MAKKKNVFREYSEALIVALVAALVLRAFVIQAFRIPTGSMKDTLLIGDFLLVNKFIYGVRTPDRIIGTNIKIPFFRLPKFREPKRGDIIIFKWPNDTKLDYIKRCVGLPGDTLEVRDNVVFINGQSEGEQKYLYKKYDAFATRPGTYKYYQITKENGLQYVIRKYDTRRPSSYSEYGPVVIPPDHLFMMGDNRDNSSDSRDWGFMPVENVVGQALVIYFSWDKDYKPIINIFGSVRWGRIFSIIR